MGNFKYILYLVLMTILKATEGMLKNISQTITRYFHSTTTFLLKENTVYLYWVKVTQISFQYL